jgi:hypothetical protein
VGNNEMLCRTCKKQLKKIPQGFDAFSFLSPVEQMYCENNECKEFGYVVVVGLKEPAPSVAGEENKEIK